MQPKQTGASNLVGRFTLLLAMLTIGAVLAAPSSATFSGRNGRISFGRFVERTQGVEIFSARPNGRDLKKLTTSKLHHSSVISDWSPDSHRIAFDSDRVDVDGRKNVVQVYVMNADGSAERQLTKGAGFHGEPGWSPDADSLAINADWGRPRFQGIWIISASDPNGVTRPEARPLTNGPPLPGADAEPQFCPGGRTIVFTRFKDESHSAIYRVRMGGGGLTRLTPYSLNASDPDCSPNGRRITFDSGDAGRPGSKGDIYVMRVDGSRLRRLTDRPRLREDSPFDLANNPVWSPSGNEIMYTQFLDRRNLLILMNADGSGKHVAVRLGGFPNKVDWGARR
jgi:Tol biopolymer transport system component